MSIDTNAGTDQVEPEEPTTSADAPELDAPSTTIGYVTIDPNNPNWAPAFAIVRADVAAQAQPGATVADVAMALRATEQFDPARVLAQVMSAFGSDGDGGADLVDTLQGILSHIHSAANLPGLGADDEENVAFWNAVADDGGVPRAHYDDSE
jgi:hypothetical protein